MQFTTSILAVLAAASTTFAAPAAAAAKDMMAATSQWTIQDFQRQCGGGVCHYNYTINANDGSLATGCKYDVNGSPATHASYNSVKCGNFTVGSSWSGQFGADAGFQTLSVVKGGLIVYPSYSDKQLAGGKVVKPDQSYTPQNLP